MSKVIGCDVGGTFTDLILLDESAGEVRIAKVPTTPDNQAIGVMQAIAAAGAECKDKSLHSAPPPPPMPCWRKRQPCAV